MPQKQLKQKEEKDDDKDECDELLDDILGNSRKKSVACDLIRDLNVYLRKPTIECELSAVLSKYLYHLHESQVFLSNGVFNTNFAEGALLIQSATNLYAKKIDLLWECMVGYQERMILYEDRTEANEHEFQKMEERKDRFKKKRKKTAPDPEPGELDIRNTDLSKLTQQPKSPFKNDGMPLAKKPKLQDFIDEDLVALLDMSARDLQLKGDKPGKSYKETWRDKLKGSKSKVCPVLTNSFNQLITNYEEVREIVGTDIKYKTTQRYSLKEWNIDGELEGFCDYHDTCLTTLCDKQTEDYKYLQRYIEDPSDIVVPKHVTDFVFDFLFQHELDIDDLSGNPNNFIAYFNHYLTTAPLDKLPKDLHEYSRLTLLNDVNKLKSIIANLENLPEEIVTKLMEARKKNDIDIFIEGDKSDKVDGRRKTTESRSDIDSGFFEHEAESNAAKTNESSRATPFMPGLSPVWEVEENYDSGMASSLERSFEVPKNNETIVEEIKVQLKSRKRKLKFKLTTPALDSDESDEEGNVRKKVRRPYFKLRPTTTTTFDKFEAFFTRNYHPAVDEGPIILYDYDESDCGDDNREDIVENVINPEDVTVVKKPPVIDIFENIWDDIDPLNIVDLEPTDFEKRYTEWKDFITEKIGGKTYCDFDIHDEGTKIIESIGTIGETVKYKTLCKGKNRCEVARNFTAVLQLANTYNVQIKNIVRNGLSDDSVQLKLLSKDRHHENLDEYQAPSELTLNDRMKNIRNDLKGGKSVKRLKSTNHKHCTSFAQPSTSYGYVEPSTSSSGAQNSFIYTMTIVKKAKR